jgi:hypothetical protein
VIIIKDRFLPNPLEARRDVLKSEFKSKDYMDGATYTGISDHPTPGWHDLVARVVGCPIVSRLSCFRLNLRGELPHTWVHADSICAKFASVLYLNLPSQCEGGTAFWRHRTKGIEALPPREKLGENAEPFYREMEKEWKELEHWEQVNLVPMRFNRFITYPTAMFHSRYPFEGFGSGPEDGRLIWICFYDLGSFSCV